MRHPVNILSPTSDDFYYALFAIQKFAKDVAHAIIRKCAESFGNPANPLDAAIRCYSILIRNLYATNKRQLADVVVCDFLRSLPGEEKEFEKKMQCLYLILTDRAAYEAAPREIKNEIFIGLTTPSSFLRRVLSVQPQGSTDVAQANVILEENGIVPDVAFSEEHFKTRKSVSSGDFPDLMIDVFGQYAGGRKLKLKSRSKSRSSRNKSKRKNKNKKKTLRLRIKK
jgi:hypothetical protein